MDAGSANVRGWVDEKQRVVPDSALLAVGFELTHVAAGEPVRSPATSSSPKPAAPRVRTYDLVIVPKILLSVFLRPERCVTVPLPSLVIVQR